jgi:hypothetical protein
MEPYDFYLLLIGTKSVYSAKMSQIDAPRSGVVFLENRMGKPIKTPVGVSLQTCESRCNGENGV